MSNAPNASNTRQVTGTFRFIIEISGIIEAGFSEVSGLQMETELEEFSEGGLNEYTHRFPKKIKYPPLVFKRGIIKSNSLWLWYQGFIEGKIKRTNGSIILNSLDGTALGRWNFFDAYPVKWSGPDLSATRSDVAVESIEIVHNGLKAVFSG
jgi:phage tail-like protein